MTLEEKIDRLTKEEIHLTGHRAEWKEIFLNEKSFLLEQFPHLIKKVEHIGSTAIPKICSKPIIDMLVIVNDIEDAKNIIAPFLEKLKYEYFWRPLNETSTSPHYAWFIKRDQKGKRTHHIHIIDDTFEKLKESIAFRDFLNQNHEHALAYEELKINLAKQFTNDRIAYTQGKTDFIRNISNLCKNKPNSSQSTTQI